MANAINVYNGNTSSWVQVAGAVDTGRAYTFTASQTFQSPVFLDAGGSLNNPFFISPTEAVTISATAATGTVNYDCATQGVLYYTTAASANWTINFRGSSTVSLNTYLQNNESLTVALLVTQGATAYYPTAFQIDGVSVTPIWAGGIAPTAGNVNSVDMYTFTIIKIASATYTVLAGQVQFK